MKEIKAIIRGNRLDHVLDMLYAHPKLPGLAISNVSVFGRTVGRKDVKSVSDVGHDTVSRIMLQCIVDEAHMEEIIGVIREGAHTGIPGDGVISISEVEEMIRIRTGERGDRAV